MGLTYPPFIVAIVLMVVTITAAVYDVRFRRIPNWVSVTGVVVGVGLNAFLGSFEHGALSGAWFSVKGLLLGFGIYFVLWMLRFMGAGDAKLMGAVGALVGPVDWFGIFFVSVLLGGVLGILLVLLKGRVQKTLGNMLFLVKELLAGRRAYLKREELDVKNPSAVGLPHGAVIAIGSAFFLGLARHYAGGL